ncbi:unnamed protein product [Lactuca saligna]|uniref:Uncharacterized protein n=1 Tax=Lactuca saligna TaxID=75948 RepID=A0AA35ZVS7_LACSI|nr:unnamed protein product [Lactuca saligna]
MTTIDPKVETGKLLPKAGAGLSKKSRTTKKPEIIIPKSIVKETKTSKSPKTKPNKIVSKAVTTFVEPIVTEPALVTIPSKSGVLRRLQLRYGGSPTSNVVHKPYITHQGVVMREVLAPVSPHSKKRRAEDMAKKLSKKKKKTKKRQLVIPMEYFEEEQVPETPELEPIIEPTSPEKTVVIPPEVSSAKSFHEEVRTSGITTNICDMDYLCFFTSIHYPYYFHHLFTNLPKHHRPTFFIHFSSQSTDPPKPNDESKNDEGGFGGTFDDLAFHEDEEDFPNHMLMSMKQFKILNKKLNSIIQSQADMGGGSSVSTFEIDGLMKACEARMVSKISGMIKDSEINLLEKIDHTDETTKLRTNFFNSKYVGDVKELTNVQKERHTLFVMDVKKVREDVNLNLRELREDMVHEVAVVQNDYATLHKKVDIICDAITKYVTLYESLSPRITQLYTNDNQQFGMVISMLKD